MNITASVRSFINYVLLAKRAGVTIEEVCELVNLDISIFKDIDARVPYEVYPKLLCEVVKRTGNEMFWLESPTADIYPTKNLFLYMVFSAKTLKESVDLAERYYRLVTDTFYPSFVLRDSELAIRFYFSLPEEKITPYTLDFVVATHKIFAQMWGGDAFKVRGVNLTSRFSVRKKDYEKHFSVPIETGQAFNELLFDRDCAELPNHWRPYDPNLEKILLRQVKHNYETRFEKTDFSEKLSQAIKNNMQQGTPTLDAVARDLGMSSRGLQRKLAGMNTSFTEQLQQLRKRLAGDYLAKDKLSLIEVTYLLGFQDASSLTAAFRKWYGVPPSVYREQECEKV